MLIATPTYKNDQGHLWICKVVDVVMHENMNLIKSMTLIKSITMHWYNTRSKNAFIGKYTLEMTECPTSRGHKRRKRDIRKTSTLNISEVDIIVYNFTLRKNGCLRRPTINIIKEKLLSLQGFSDWRRTRLDEPNLEPHHLVLD